MAVKLKPAAGEKTAGWYDLSPTVRRVVAGGLIGAPVGAGVGYLKSRSSDDKHPIRDSAVGALLGAGVGSGAGLLLDRMRPVRAAPSRAEADFHVGAVTRSLDQDYGSTVSVDPSQLVFRSPVSGKGRIYGHEPGSPYHNLALGSDPPHRFVHIQHPEFSGSLARDSASRPIHSSPIFIGPSGSKRELGHLAVNPDALVSSDVKRAVARHILDQGKELPVVRLPLEYSGSLQHDRKVSAEVNEMRRLLRAKAGDLPRREKIAEKVQTRGRIKQATIESNQVRAGTPVVGSLKRFERKLLPGDIIISKIGDPKRALGGSKILSGTIKAYDALSGAKHPGWGHTALYVGDGKIQHLYDEKLRRGSVVDSSPNPGTSILVKDSLNILDTQGYDLLALRPRSGGEQAVATLNELSKQPLTMTSGKFVRNLLRTGLTPVGGDSLQDAVCSGVIGAAFPPDAIAASRKPFSIRPKDMLESRKLRHLVAYENQT